jgi:hypothetical protein
MFGKIDPKYLNEKFDRREKEMIVYVPVLHIRIVLKGKK